MRNTILLILLMFGLFGCSDDENVNFDVEISENMFSFTPTEGGAVMRYSLADRRINRVKAEYTDEYGTRVYKVADYAVDTLILDGFNQVHENVPVKVSFLDKNEQESKVMNFTFDTRPSALYSFFDKVEVSSYWNGFQVICDLEGRTEGSASVYFVGINPTTKLRDTIFLENFRLTNGHSVKAYSLDDSQQQEDYTIVITTEDDRQRIARKQIWTGVKGATRALIPNYNFELFDPFNKSKEMPRSTDSWNPGALGKGYLFDGDVKGTQALEYYRRGYATPPFTFLAGPNALNRPGNDVYFVLDIKEPAIVGEMRLYMRIQDEGAINHDFDNGYYTKLPCNVQVYAWVGDGDYHPTTNPGTKADWELIGNFEQDPGIEETERWYVNKEKVKDQCNTLTELAAVEAHYLSIPFPFEEREYRFLKIQFNETYVNTLTPDYDHNNNNNVTFHELEIYGVK
ncbi:DUF4959 domain-containing protein [Butyricimonas paravirosa]|uniref:DUF4959 domain-containing protein n=1 Tax=Butyricimonas paravirosa TaxID=1472417 RepID=UPI0022E10595|nr:DUF4959 domain-containing protein [Butyricimonas paravirosa]